jgi:uncharacterized membrane protein YfcA
MKASAVLASVTGLSNKMTRFGLLLLMVPCVLLVGSYIMELSTVNACLDQGGSFDYLKQLCSFDQEHPFIPFSRRHGVWVNGSMLVALFGFLLCLIGLYQRRR